MLYAQPKSTGDLIVEFLATRDATVSEIHKILFPMEEISLQAVYDAVRSLNNAGVILKQKKSCSLSAEWKKRVVENLQMQPGLPRLEEGDNLKISFHTYIQLDLYWKHINALFTDIDLNSPIFFFVSHQIWIYLQGREESQDVFLRSFKKNNRLAFTLVGNNTPLDLLYKKRYEAYLKIELEPGTILPEGPQLTVCGDYVVVTKIPETVSEKINELYRTTNDETVLRTELQRLFDEKHPLSVNIYKNKERARRLRRRIVRNMYIPRNERDLLDL